MSLTIASAPGKVILFGEHAVVSGIPALGAAIDLRVRARIEDAPGKLEISIPDMRLVVEGFSLDLITEKVLTEDISKKAILAARYVYAVLKRFDASNLRVVVESEIPPSSGLGSSASVVVATLAALNHHQELGLSLEDLAWESHQVEKEVQSGLGSPMDTALATFGGYQLIQAGPQQSLDLPELDLVVGWTGVPHDTKFEVEKVQNFRTKYPHIVGPIFESIGEISREALNLMKDGQLEELGQLMNANHGLLEAIGVGTKELSDLAYAARGAGEALGAKLTGAGGGGCIIAIPPTDPQGLVKTMTAISQAGGKPFHVATGCEGARLE